MKKLTSMFLALVMALALTVPALADEVLKVEGTIQMPTINVVMPTSASLILNPYQMSVNIGTRDNPNNVTDQIVSTQMQIKNLSNIDIQVGAKALGTISTRSGIAFDTSSVASNTTDKKAYIYGVFEVGDLTDTFTGNEAATMTLTDTETDIPGFAFNGAASATNTLAKVGSDPKTPAPGGVLNFQFFGDMSDVTTWVENDTLGATLTFKFTPVANDTTPAVAISMTGTPAASANLTLTATLANIDSSKNPTYAWTATDTDSILDSFTGGTATSQAVNIVAGATAGQSATVTVTVTYDDAGSQDATVTDTVTITIPTP